MKFVVIILSVLGVSGEPEWFQDKPKLGIVPAVTARGAKE